MPPPLFSVVLPTYNRARMAAAAVLSLLGQTERDFEAWVVDDGSTDATPRVLAALPQDPRVRVLRKNDNRGQHARRNEAIRLSTGRYITFLDSDDLYLPERLAAFRKAVEDRPDTGFWFSNAYVRRFDRVIGLLFDPEREIPEGAVPGHYAIGDRFLPYLTTNVAIQREAFAEHGTFREDRKILEDTELYAKMFAGGLKVGVIKRPLAVRCLHEEQITREYERDFLESSMALDAGGPDAGTRTERRREVAAEVAEYLIKSFEPAAARALLDREWGEDAKSHPLYLRSYVPVPALKAAKAARGAWLRLRYGLFPPAEYRRIERIIAPYLRHAAVLAAKEAT